MKKRTIIVFWNLRIGILAFWGVTNIISAIRHNDGLFCWIVNLALMHSNFPFFINTHLIGFTKFIISFFFLIFCLIFKFFIFLSFIYIQFLLMKSKDLDFFLFFINKLYFFIFWDWDSFWKSNFILFISTNSQLLFFNSFSIFSNKLSF